MSTIKVDNIRIASESVSRPVTGVAAAWINFDGDAATAASDMAGVRDSLNVSSLVYEEVGGYQININNDMATDTYAINNFVAGGDDRRVAGSIRTKNTASKWHVSVRANATVDNNARVDEKSTSGLIHGDLA
jgi:hypothetical protein